jgi:1-acyl-sn-glycerol-3-phosphate acyltransferase
MYLSNHTSWLDILVILYSSKKMVHFIAKKELGKLPFIGFIMRRMGMIFVDRGNTKNSAKSVKETLARIKGGTTIVAFPEGTRSPDGKIGVFKKGLFGIAMKAGIDIVPVGIVGSSAVWHRNNTTFRPGIIEVNYGKPIRTTDYTDENISDLIVRVKNEIMVLSKQAHS